MEISGKEIVRQYLRDNKFDGLYYEFGECGCELDDLMPCDSMTDKCYPGIKKVVTGDNHWVMCQKDED